MNNNLEFENEDPSPDSIEDNHPRTNYGEGYYVKETLEEEFKFKNRQMGAAGFVGNKIMENMISKFKQETPEEAAERLYPKYISDPYNPSEDLLEEERNIFIEGAKWQAERMYSEEEVLELILKSKIETSNLYYEDMKEWFEQIKKK
jgi:hypothetical protein